MKSSASLVAAITATAIVLAEGHSPDELSLLSAVFTQLGDTLATISANDEIIQNEATPAASSSSDTSDASDTSDTQQQTDESKQTGDTEQADKTKKTND